VWHAVLAVGGAVRAPGPAMQCRSTRRDEVVTAVTGTIFDRYGGFSTMRKVVSAFYDDVLDSPSLAHHFADTDMRELIRHQTVFIAYLTGGPGANYTDEALERVHRRLGITRDEFDEMLELLRDTLLDHDFDSTDVETITGEFRKRQHTIVVGV
jgi:hemoglobin